MTTTFDAAIAEADAKWGPQSMLQPEVWLAVLVEEVGEVARAALERDYPQMRRELEQVGAVCARWLRAAER